MSQEAKGGIRRALVLDVESKGLHGVGFAWGAMVIEDGVVVGERLEWSDPTQLYGSPGTMSWLEKNVLPKLYEATGGPTQKSIRPVRDEFWALWWRMRQQGAEMWADVTFPVESNFLTSCIMDDTTRYWDSPYPLLDIGTLRRAGLASLAEDAHDPLIDARASWESMSEWWIGNAERQDRDSETSAGWPSGHSMIVQLREALGLFAGAMPISPQQAWEEALTQARHLAGTRTDTAFD